MPSFFFGGFALFKTRTRPHSAFALKPVVTVAFTVLLAPLLRSSTPPKKPFTLNDEIELRLFGTPNGFGPEVHYSPDGNYFVVWSERGRLKADCVEDSLRFYRSQDVALFLDGPNSAVPLLPVWDLILSNKDGPVITDWHWQADSRGVAFLERVADGNQRLVFADLRKKKTRLLTPPMDPVRAFDLRDEKHYVYTVTDPSAVENLIDEHRKPALRANGRSLFELLLPNDAIVAKEVSNRTQLWSFAGTRRFQVTNNGSPVLLYGGDLALSPDGYSVVTTLPVFDVPPEWEVLFPPSFASSPYRIRSGHFDRKTGRGGANQYVLVNLRTGSVESLTNAPASAAAGWWAGSRANWSSDGQEIILPGTFLEPRGSAPSRPCVAVVNVASRTSACVEILKGHRENGVEEGYHRIKDARFADGDKRRIIVTFYDHRDLSIGSTEYRATKDGGWEIAKQEKDGPRPDFTIGVEESFAEPPQLVASNQNGSRVLWDPNPQLKDIDLGEASIYKWNDKQGRHWTGGLYKPSNYVASQAYPLVIQTHGFQETEFRPSGLFPTVFAARALAASGIMVLQVNDDQCVTTSPYEGQCTVSGYEAAAEHLVSEGLADPSRIGIVGFSRTCFYVMEMLTTSPFRLRAALIADGVMENYLQYMTMVDWYGDKVAAEANSMIGARPFGTGLQRWLQRSPGFNLDKVRTPLAVVGEGPVSLLVMWEPYAGLRYLGKPVDLVMLNTDEHVLTNPAVRMASQSGTVDWFRFWLKDEEDPDPAKAEQYACWRELRKSAEKDNDGLPGAWTPVN